MNWPKNQDEVKALTSEQVDWLMQGFQRGHKQSPLFFRVKSEDLMQ